MQRLLREWLRGIALHKAGYLVGGFLLIASLTCGIMQGNMMQVQTSGLDIALTVPSVLGMIGVELLFGAGLLLALTHPFGCALCAGILIIRGFQAGLILGCWPVRFGLLPFCLVMLQALIAICGDTSGCCIGAYAALRISSYSRAKQVRRIILTILCRLLCDALRCIACAWIAV